MLQSAGPESTAVAGKITPVEVAGETVAVYRLDDGVYVTTDTCPHATCSLAENADIFGDVVECSCHGSSFNIRTGDNVNPPSAEPLRTYPVTLEDEQILIDLG